MEQSAQPLSLSANAHIIQLVHGNWKAQLAIQNNYAHTLISITVMNYI